MDYIYILVSIDADSYSAIPQDIGHYRTEEAAVSAIPRDPVDFLKMENHSYVACRSATRTTVRYFTYYRVDKVELLG